jgi:shikimate dehydrogenase
MKAAVLGSPIAHSLSPVLHRAAYQALGLDHTFEAVEVTEVQFSDFVRSLDSSWFGLSLTMPLKEIAFDVADTVDEVARQAGAINTLVLGDTISAYNTDVAGIVDSFLEFGVSAPKSAVILGAGATARSALVAFSELGVKEVNVVARNQTKANHLIELGRSLQIEVAHKEISSSGWLDAPVVINTTPKGAMDEIAMEVERPKGTLLDVVYDPWPTLLAASWGVQGGQILSGLTMLLHQAAHGVELMTGQPGPVEAMRAGLNEELLSRGLATI